MPALNGCDYWPPALQAQIEQMQVETQIAMAERAKLQGQLTEAMKTKEELQVRVDELSRSNRELSGRVSHLDQALAAERQKPARHVTGSQKSAPAKAAVKNTHKAAVPKKSGKPPSGKRHRYP